MRRHVNTVPVRLAVKAPAAPAGASDSRGITCADVRVAANLVTEVAAVFGVETVVVVGGVEVAGVAIVVVVAVVEGGAISAVVVGVVGTGTGVGVGVGELETCELWEL